ncbi:GNAT family N-acetyltransferase [Paenibacillus ihbetae]|uniref:GNAT family N-acetyltransferase n=1 Tax=Paenibacillus ihbetae TaxID=1870820 RepID=UPI000986FCFC|nr:GNAT family N-acetyltransferase [Paenibacillus ihbetae]
MNIRIIRNFRQDDMPLLGALYEAVRQGVGLFWWVGDEDNWTNVFCAFEEGKMVAKGQVAVINVLPEGCPESCKHHIYVNLKTVPERERDTELLEELYQRLYTRALELKETLPRHHGTYLCVGNFAHEERNTAFFTEEKGFRPLENLYSMVRTLNRPIPSFVLPDNFSCLLWDMQTEREEARYLKLEAEVWPDAPLGLNRLREYKAKPNWTAIIAAEGEQIAASVMAWQEKGGNGVIEDVFVREPWRRQGLAKYLLSRAMNYLREHGAETAELEVKAANASALSLYQSVGFAQAGEEHRFYVPIP